MELPCPPPPFEYPEYWPSHHSHRALCEWWGLWIEYGRAWAVWASVAGGGYIQ